MNTKVIIDDALGRGVRRGEPQAVGQDEQRDARAASGTPPTTPAGLALTESKRWLERATACIPGITQSMMKRPEQFSPGSFPVYLESGEGAVVRDVDGNEFIDFICGLAANSLGHQHPAVIEALQGAFASGLLHSLPAPLEVRVAEQLVRLIPNAEMVRFFKTGADATSAAVRLARAATGRQRLVTVGYNGWHDHFMFDTPGVPEPLQQLTRRMSLVSVEDEARLLSLIEQGRGELAALLLSVPYNRELSSEFLQQLRRACTESGTWLILDEIVTGFRLALGGAQEYFGVEADLVCLSKALAAGMPLSAVAGPAQHMRQMERLQVSTTFGGELLSLAVCSAALSVYERSNYFQHIAQLGRQVKEGVNRVAEQLGSPLRVCGYDPIPMFLFDRDPAQHVPLMTRFVGLMASRGILLRRDVNFICAAHQPSHVERLVAATHDSLQEMAR